MLNPGLFSASLVLILFGLFITFIPGLRPSMESALTGFSIIGFGVLVMIMSQTAQV